MNFVVIVIALLMLLSLVYQYRQTTRYQTQVRQHMFDELALMLDAVSKTTTDQANLPTLHGQYAGYQVAFSVVEDTLGWRKLPPLWLLIKVEGKQLTQGTLDMIVRPSNQEFYSPSWAWDGHLALPPTWPQHAVLKYQQQAVDVTLLEPFLPTLFADAKMKELLVMPHMLRLTYMVKQAERGNYLLLRKTIFDATPIPKAEVEALLKQAIALRAHTESASAGMKSTGTNSTSVNSTGTNITGVNITATHYIGIPSYEHI